MQKRDGKIEIVVPMFLLVFVIILVACMLQMYQFEADRAYAEDALAASGLASAVIDIQEYGTKHYIVIADPGAAYETYQRALKANMGLDDNWESQNTLAISGRVDILEYTVYNVRGQDVQITSFGEDPYTADVPGGLGSVTAPNGKIIESTSIYSRISFPVEGIFGIRVTAQKDKLVDVVGGQP